MNSEMSLEVLEEYDYLDIDRLKREFEEEDRLFHNYNPEKLIDKMVVNCEHINNTFTSLEFIDNKTIVYFGINSDLSFNNKPKLPKLVNHKTRNLSIDLTDGYYQLLENEKLFEDYGQYRQIKWRYFLKSLRDNNVIDKTKPKFVGFRGVFANFLQCTEELDYDRWIVNAQKFNGVIYLFSHYIDSESKCVNEKSYCGLKFLYLMTDRDPNTMNQFEKIFAINSMKFGEHSIVSLNEIDCIGNYYGLPIELRVKQMPSNRERKMLFKHRNLIQVWAQCLVAGIDRIIYGFRDSVNYLKQIKEYKTDDIPNRCDKYWSDVKCLNFHNRLLHYINQCVTEECVLYEFCYYCGEQFIDCIRFNPNFENSNSFLPKWYINGQQFC